MGGFMKRSESILIGIVFYLLTIPATFVSPVLGIVCFLVGNVAMFWNVKWGVGGGNHYHTHHHYSENKNEVLDTLKSIREGVKPQNVTQAIEHRVENETGQALSVRKITKWH
jgi:xanthosine utilization system XapX-like protein